MTTRQPDNQTPASEIMLLHRLILYSMEFKMYNVTRLYINQIIKANNSLESEIKQGD